ncbi:AraC family transcriptional regulator [Corallincola luteus]|uniref:AraC family transcriptional regulator n=1 Tax=Corallincola luteus TaxID=1775177 RepID=A0ABY2AL66_9GAMM|nr:AraC family transcriptional regulator [Corallincola luteus]TCI02174.1 AraC family transcriptional regulator [Corallincola luteus]
MLKNQDPLSELLHSLKLRAEVYVHADFCGHWAVDTSGQRRIPFHMLGSGQGWLHIEGNQPRLLKAGDLVVFPHDVKHLVSSETEICAGTRLNDPGNELDGPAVNLLCGFFDFESLGNSPILDQLPDVIVLELGEQSRYPHIRTLIQLMVTELENSEPGSYAAVNQICYLLFVQVLRLQIAESVDTGLLAALFDSRIGKALDVIHKQPEVSWDLVSLAQTAAMGRTNFAERFHQLVGLTPMKYLTRWRMQKAKMLLVTSDRSMMDIAEACGYQSEVAFRKAYRSNVGEPPGQTRRAAG